MGKTDYQTANQRLVLFCIFPEPHDSSHRGSRALATRLIVARFQGDSSCLTIDNIKPELCRNSAPLYNPMSVVDNSAPLFFHSSHFNCNDNKSNPLSRVLKENINKIYKMQHFSTLENAAYKFFKTFRANPAWAECVSRDRRVEYFREDRQHIACDNSEPKLT